ncbi:apolipoprotein N-acyltransferase [Mesorhizobium sp. RP14(2022)]|uniref:Apolipoprotein N-acyltransferase n=1 Tax=Mesorhizobium liriopis TaxID=2953882 RepID=A0ABT1C986_9HYPH|nr:apolipoprotein N-acyltransferase [Mesorhizobium liriopis]MCO6051405.1 apolipoprotein N-acyltransferase [Mesorhizobium liriopis]
MSVGVGGLEAPRAADRGPSALERLANSVILLWGWRRYALIFTAGALFVLAQAPYDFFAVGFLSFPLLVWLLDGAVVGGNASLWQRARPFFALGWWFGLGTFLFGLWWVGGAMLIESETYIWALPIVALGLPLLLAPFYGLATLLARLFWDEGLGRIFALAFGFGLAEWLRNWVLTGFPWNPVGFATMPVPLAMQSTYLIGTIGMNAAAVFVFAAPALLGSGRHRRVGLALAFLLVAAHLSYGAWRLDQPIEGTTLRTRIVQPSIDLTEKWDGEVRDRIFATMLDLSKGPPDDRGAPIELTLWPETSVPFLLTERPDALSALGKLEPAGEGLPDHLTLVGAVRAEGEMGTTDERYYNALVAVDRAGLITGAMDKVHRVPFGEYIPFASLFSLVGVEQIVAGPMTFEAGVQRHNFTLPGGLIAAPFICYEIIFPEEVDAGSAGADLLVNVTNDGWFGDTAGPYQHFRNFQIRAAETGKPGLRSANNGISGAVDARGRVADALAMNERGRIDLSLTVPKRAEMRLSPSVVGLGVVAACGVLALAFTLLGRRRMN